MAGTIFYLVRHPAALQKAISEIRAKFRDVEDIHQGPDLNSLTYLRACIDEAMRLSPSVGGLLPREVLSGGIQLDGETIPAGTVVGTPHYTVHHNPAYYPQPYAYMPERWMAGSTAGDRVFSEQDVALAQSAFCPFSIGPRGCIGKGIAYIEMTSALARLLWLYDVRAAPGDGLGQGKESNEYGRHRASEYQLIDTFTSLKDGPMVEFRKRE